MSFGDPDIRLIATMFVVGFIALFFLGLLINRVLALVRLVHLQKHEQVTSIINLHMKPIANAAVYAGVAIIFLIVGAVFLYMRASHPH